VSGSVVLLGTFSKTVSPALSAGYLLAPAGLRAVIEPARHELGGPVSAVVQAALAEYLASGELRRHTARMRRRYASRRELVVDRLGGIAGVRVRPMSGGLHAVLEFEAAEGAAAAEARVCALAARRGLGAVPLSAYWQRPAGAERGGRARTGRFGLVIGTGGSDGPAFEAALDELRALLRGELAGSG
jgi:GntR family transcriptional regulator/MocR family aminotransferase